MVEEWRDVVGYEGLYRVSSLGRVLSYQKGRVKHLSLLLKGGSAHKRAAVALFRDGVRTERKVHHLVLEAFVGPRPSGFEACHNDGNPHNNVVSNLRWDTHLSNMRDMMRHSSHVAHPGEKNGGAKLGESDVKQIISRIETGESLTSIAKHHSVSRAAISKIKNRRTWRHIDGNRAR